MLDCKSHKASKRSVDSLFLMVFSKNQLSPIVLWDIACAKRLILQTVIQAFKAVKLMSSTRVSSKSRIDSKKQTNNKPTQIDQILGINQHYSLLLRQLARVTFIDVKMSQKAKLLQTVQLLKQIKLCLRKQSNHYDKWNTNKLADFIASKRLGNAGNLIGKYEEIKDQIEVCKKQLEEAQQAAHMAQQSDLQDLQFQLQKELQQVTKKRIQAQNRQEMIKQQLQICTAQAKQGRGKLLSEQLKLRGLQGNRLK